MVDVVMATHNPGKLQEFQAMFATTQIRLVSASHLVSIEETGKSFVENALLKARHASLQTGLPALADDSGLVVDYLCGAPGIFSARYSGKGSAENMQRVLRELDGVPVDKRTARFACVIAFVRDAEDPLPIICEGLWEGRILFAPQGEQGFGYDPIFFVPECDCSAAELSLGRKNQLSHRAKALHLFLQRVTQI